MSDLRKAAEMALEALIGAGDDMDVAMQDAFDALRAALAQPESEPVAWKVVEGTGVSYLSSEPPHPSVVAACRPLYTAPPQRKPLTEEKIDELSRTMVRGDRSVNWLCRAIERAHGIGGQP